MSKELLAKLFEEVEKGNLGIQRSDDGLILFDYTRECQFSSNWNEITLMARGLVLEEATGKIVAHPLKKFFNYGEGPCKPDSLPNEFFLALDKLDGSCGICFYYNGWRICTRGSFQSEQAIWATKWLNENVDTSYMNKEFTYIFEIIYPENRIVVDYGDFSGLVLLSARNTQSGKEYPYEKLKLIADFLNVRLAKAYPFTSLVDLLKEKELLGKDREGFVVWYPESGYRFKLKGDTYCHLHRMISNLTPLAFWNAMDLDTLKVPTSFLVELPEEFRDTAEQLQVLLEDVAQKALAKVREVSERVPEFDNQKERWFWLVDNAGELAGLVHDYHRGFQRKVHEKIHRSIRPTGNVLPGFVPNPRANRLDDG